MQTLRKLPKMSPKRNAAASRSESGEITYSVCLFEGFRNTFQIRLLAWLLGF
jgi:hypothetical protein